MNRLVEQLLRVARLDAVVLDVSEVVDLTHTAEDIAATMAPLALARGRAIAFTDCADWGRIKGNAYAIGDAIRNIVENAISHAPPGSEVAISVHSDGRIDVADQGPGIPINERSKIFDRFWRGTTAISRGAGLGRHCPGCRADLLILS